MLWLCKIQSWWCLMTEVLIIFDVFVYLLLMCVPPVEYYAMDIFWQPSNPPGICHLYSQKLYVWHPCQPDFLGAAVSPPPCQLVLIWWLFWLVLVCADSPALHHRQRGRDDRTRQWSIWRRFLLELLFRSFGLVNVRSRNDSRMLFDCLPHWLSTLDRHDGTNHAFPQRDETKFGLMTRTWQDVHPTEDLTMDHFFSPGERKRLRSLCSSDNGCYGLWHVNSLMTVDDLFLFYALFFFFFFVRHKAFSSYHSLFCFLPCNPGLIPVYQYS